jgi:DNA-binding NarL/FixJ family response regulator
MRRRLQDSHVSLVQGEALQPRIRTNPPASWPLSVMMVGGSQGLRASLRAMVRQEPGFCLAGEAETGAAALELVFRWQPAFALVDVCLPDRSGFEVVKCIRQLVPTCTAIVLCDNPDPCVEAVARIIGAKAVWHKGSGVSQLSRTLRRLVHLVLAKPEPDLTSESSTA